MRVKKGSPVSAADPHKLALLAAAGVAPPTDAQTKKVVACYTEAQGVFPIKTTVYDPEPRHQYALTQFGLRPDVNELYHEQSKYHRGTGILESIPDREQENLGVFLDFTTSGFDVCVVDNGDTQNRFYDKMKFFPPEVQELVARARAEPRLLFGADLYLLFPYDGRWALFRYIISDDVLSLIRVADDERLETLGGAVASRYLWPTVLRREEARGLPLVAFIVAGIGRQILCYENRGYRIAALASGQLTSLTRTWAKDRNLSTSVYEHFYDDELNRFLGLEGLTKSLMTIIVAGLEGEA